MFSSKPKPKKVHYERGTKGGKDVRGHRSSGSRDSGLGSSSASDRASLGTSPEHDTPFTYRDIEIQRKTPSAVNEALNAANDRIKELEAANAQLNGQLFESNQKNRSLKRERAELLEKIENLLDDLEDEKKKNAKSKRESSPRTTAAPVTSKPERRSTPPKKEATESSSRRHHEGRPHGQRRESWRDLPVPLYESKPPTAPQPPSNPAPNPFMPNSSRPASMYGHYHPSSIAYAPPPQVTYAPAPITYTTAPAYPTHKPSDRYPNDGRYHPLPL